MGPEGAGAELAAGAVVRDYLEVVLHLLHGSGNAKCMAGRWGRVLYVSRADAGMPPDGVRSTGVPGLMLVYTLEAVQSAARM